MFYAVFTNDLHYHLLTSAAVSRTLCNLSTKGGHKDVREVRPAARVTPEEPPSYLYSLCPLCAEARSKI